MLNISNLASGGLITNYFCSSACGHCLYGCSPSWPKEYITPETAKECLGHIKRLGCGSIHIGGGEPLLRPAELMQVLRTARGEGVHVEYVETNSSWHKDEASAIRLLNELRECGLETLLVSISPFHNEYIPFKKVQGVLAACEQAGMGIFPWVMDFYRDLDRLDPAIKHGMEEFKETFGEDYPARIPGRYWITMRGRALETFRELHRHISADEIVGNAPGGCRELAETGHFHVDLYGNYIPGLCSGFGIRAQDLGKPLDDGRYRFLNVLYDQGIGAFFRLAREEYGFSPRQSGYVSKCDLCTDIRRYLVLEKGEHDGSLSPEAYYREITAQGMI